MYNYSGLIHDMKIRGWGLVLLGIIVIVIEMLSRKKKKIKNAKKKIPVIGLVSVACGLVIAMVYLSRIITPGIASYAGEFENSFRDGRRTFSSYKYTFCSGEGEKKTFYLDTRSKNTIFPEEFQKGEEYVIYYDEMTKIIVKVEKTD